MTMTEVIRHHLGASEPCTFESCFAYVKEQYNADSTSIEGFQVVDALNTMLHRGEIQLYDTGDAFTMGPRWEDFEKEDLR